MTIRDIGLGIVRAIPGFEMLGRKLYGWLPAEMHDTPTSRLRGFFGPDEEIAFIQIGAFDGIAGDPIRSVLVDRPRWRGVLVEPQPHAFERLRENYSSQAGRLQFLNAAVSTISGEQTFFSIPLGEMQRLGLPDWTQEVASFNANHLKRYFPSAEVEAAKVTTLTFAEVAGSLPDGHVDLIVMDVEGHELAIIETIDVDRHMVRFIVYEHKHMAQAEKSRVESLLCSRRFSLKDFGRDTIAWRSVP